MQLQSMSSGGEMGEEEIESREHREGCTFACNSHIGRTLHCRKGLNSLSHTMHACHMRYGVLSHEQIQSYSTVT